MKMFIKRVFSSLPLIVGLLVISFLIFGGLWLKNRSSNKTTQDTQKPKYFSFSGSYVFTIPDNTALDEYAIPGIQLLYTDVLEAKTLEEIYAVGGISIQPLTFLTDRSKDGFKKYVNETFIPDIKKNLSEDIQLKFESVRGDEVARITVRKDNAPHRFIFLKNGQHPVSIIAREETDKFRQVAETITDVEKSQFKDDAEQIKKVILETTQLVKSRKAKEIYESATTELKGQTSEATIASALNAIKEYTDGNITIEGGSIANNNVFTAIVSYAPLNKDIKPLQGSFRLDKSEGTWKLKGMSLPAPSTEKRQR